MASPDAATAPEVAAVAGEPRSSAVIESVDLSYVPDTLTILANTPVALTLENRGEAVHGFTIDALDVAVEVAPGERASLMIEAPVGDHEFYSDVPGHREAGMVGTLFVRDARSSSEVGANSAAAASPVAGP